MRNSLFQTVVMSLVAITIGASFAAMPALAAIQHSGGGSHHVTAFHRGGGGHVRYAGHQHRRGNAYYGGGGYYGGCDDQGYYNQGCGPGLVDGIIGGAMGAVGGY